MIGKESFKAVKTDFKPRNWNQVIVHPAKLAIDFRGQHFQLAIHGMQKYPLKKADKKEQKCFTAWAPNFLLP